VYWQGQDDFEDPGEIDRAQICNVTGYIVESETIGSMQRITSLSKEVMKGPVAGAIEYAVEQSHDKKYRYRQQY